MLCSGARRVVGCDIDALIAHSRGNFGGKA